MRKFSLALFSMFALAVSIPNFASSGELVKDNDCGLVIYSPGYEEPKCNRGETFQPVGVFGLR